MRIHNPNVVRCGYPLIWIAVVLALLTRESVSYAQSDVKLDSKSTGAIRPPAEFTIGREGRAIIIPVEVGGREILCVLDIGASACGFDLSMKEVLGGKRGRLRIQTPAGRQIVETFDWPEARLNGELLKTDHPVLCVDLEEIRQVSGVNVRGFLGMDVLRTRRIQIDFDAGTLKFLDSLPEGRAAGAPIPITPGPDGTPWIEGSLNGSTAERFLIDTGAQGNSLKAELFDDGVEQGSVLVRTPSASVTLAGMIQGEAGRMERLAVGPFRHDGLRVARMGLSSVGLRYLSRFRITFDFPENVLYLQKGEGYSKPEPQATSGMLLSFVKGEVVITAVLRGGPAAAADLRQDDVLLNINGKKADEYDHFSLRALLTSQVGRKVPMTVRRGNREFDLQLVLAEK